MNEKVKAIWDFIDFDGILTNTAMAIVVWKLARVDTLTIQDAGVFLVAILNAGHYRKTP